MLFRTFFAISYTIVFAIFLSLALVRGAENPHTYFTQFSGSGVLQDQGYFPIGVWYQEAFNIKKYQDAGINLYVTKESTPMYATQCRAYGMPVIMQQSPELLAMLPNFKDVIVGWSQQDEPDIAQALPTGGYGPCLTSTEVVNRYKAMQAKDATRPVYLNFSQGVSYINWVGRGSCRGKWKMYREYSRGADMVCFDIYPVKSKYAAVKNNLWYVPKGVDSLHAWTDNKKPVWTYIECTKSKTGAKPTIGQIKSEIWMSLVHGANAILYFCHSFYGDVTNPDALLDDPVTLAGIKKINHRITSLAPVLNSPTVKGRVTCSAKNVDIMVKEYNGDLFIFAVEMTGAAAAPTFTVSAAPQNGITVLDENRTQHLAGGGFSDTFTPYGVHLYQIGDNLTALDDARPVSAPDLAATQNPFTDRTELVVRNSRGREVEQITVLRMDGTAVTILPVQYGKAVWNGTDKNGRQVPPGVYTVLPDGGTPVRLMKAR